MAGLRITNVQPDDIFNLPLFEHHLVIDTRSTEAFAAGHIATAVSLPGPAADQFSDEANEVLLVSFVVELLEDGLQPENISPVVVYGDGVDGSNAQCFMRWLAERLVKLQNNKPFQVATLQPQESGSVEDRSRDEPLLRFSSQLRDATKDVWLLAAGYEAFQTRYPFLSGQVTFGELVPMPHRIMSSIFMGSRPFKLALAEDVSWLHKLGITHAIVDSEFVLSNEVGLTILRCDVPDSDTSPCDMTACFDASILCINEALAQGTCVLVQVHGRSRSASVIIAWLMQTRRLTFEAAYKSMAGRCWKRIDPTLVYADQLRQRQLPLAIDSVPEEWA